MQSERSPSYRHEKRSIWKIVSVIHTIEIGTLNTLIFISRVFYAQTKMAHLRLLGIRRIGLFFSIRILYFVVGRNGSTRFFYVLDSFLFFRILLPLALFRIHFDKTHNANTIQNMWKIHSPSFFFLILFAICMGTKAFLQCYL